MSRSSGRCASADGRADSARTTPRLLVARHAEQRLLRGPRRACVGLAAACAARVRRRDRDQELVVQPVRVQARPVACADGNGRVEVVVEEIDGADPRMEVHGHARMRGVEIVQVRQQPFRAECGQRREPQRTGARLVGHRLQRRAADAPQRTAQLGEVAAPDFGQLDRAALAPEQRHAELILERLDLPADRALAQRQLLGRARVAFMPRGGLEHEQQRHRRGEATVIHEFYAIFAGAEFVCFSRSIQRYWNSRSRGNLLKSCFGHASRPVPLTLPLLPHVDRLVAPSASPPAHAYRDFLALLPDSPGKSARTMRTGRCRPPTTRSTSACRKR